MTVLYILDTQIPSVVHVFGDPNDPTHETALPVEMSTSDLVELTDDLRAVWPFAEGRPQKVKTMLRVFDGELTTRYEHRSVA